MSDLPKLIRITTVPLSLKVLLKGQLRYMKDHGFEVVAISSPEKELAEVSEAEEVRTMAVEMTRMITPFKDIAAILRLYRIFKDEKPDIVHSHTPKAGLVAMLAGKLAGVPIRIHTVAGLPLMESKGIKRWVLSQVEKVVYFCSSKVYTNSKNLRKFILENKLTAPEKIKVIRNGSSNGIDTSFFSKENFSQNESNSLMNSIGVKPVDFVFIFVGRMVNDKGLNELVEAFSRISAKYSNAKLLLVGEYEKNLDPVWPKTEMEIRNNPQILTTGFQRDVRPYLAVANALVFPSYREGFPNVVMQAGAMELPAIVTDINGCNEIIENGENGILIPVKDSVSLENSMISFLEDHELVKKLQDKARGLIASRYEQSSIWEAWVQEYQELLFSK